MKTKLTIILIVTLGFLFTSCKEKEEKAYMEEVKVDIINDEFPEAQAEIKNILDEDYAYVLGNPMPGRTFFAGLRLEY